MYIIYDAEGWVVGTIDPNAIKNTNIKEVLEQADYVVEPIWKRVEDG